MVAATFFATNHANCADLGDGGEDGSCYLFFARTTLIARAWEMVEKMVAATVSGRGLR